MTSQMMVYMYVYHVSLEGSNKQLLHGHVYSVMESIATTIRRKLSGHDLMAHGQQHPLYYYCIVSRANDKVCRGPMITSSHSQHSTV